MGNSSKTIRALLDDPSDKTKLEKLFKTYDTDHSGFLTYDEFKDYCKCLGNILYDEALLLPNDGKNRIPPSKMRKIEAAQILASGYGEDLFNEMDLDKNGEITFEEWYNYLSKHGLREV
jgi:Ca2+-binding EF-hand superfamily protein